MEQECSLPLVIEYFSIFSLLGGKKNTSCCDFRRYNSHITVLFPQHHVQYPYSPPLSHPSRLPISVILAPSKKPSTHPNMFIISLFGFS